MTAPADTPTPCIIYLRFSPRRHEEDCESNEIQLAYCEQYAANRNYSVQGVFEDRAISGKTEERPGLFEALEALPRGGVLLVYKRDRLARNVYLEEVIKKAVRERNGRIEAVQGDVEGDGPEQELIRQMLSSISEYERKMIAIRTRWAMLDKQSRGQRMGRYAPYGWRLDPGAEGGMVEEPREQPVIDAVADMIGKGMKTSDIVRSLNRSFRHLARGNGGFQQKTVQKIVDRIEFSRGRASSTSARNGIRGAKKMGVVVDSAG